MCLISAAVNRVNNTQLLCAVNRNKTRQFTVYANKVDNPTLNNTMILPVPFPQTIKFHNLSDYKRIFNDCDSCFSVQAMRLEVSFGMAKKCRGGETLKVVSVGSYQASIANSLDELNLVNPDVFTITNEIKQFLAKHYQSMNFGFIICKLEVGNKDYHPFAYSHDIADQKIFLPTKHFHMHINPMSYFTPQTLVDEAFADDWGHDIYLFNVTCNSNDVVKKMNKSKYVWKNICKIDMTKLDGFEIDNQCRNFEKVQINGNHPNIDIILACV